MTTDTAIDRLLININKTSMCHDDKLYGLPLYSDKQRELLENVVKNWLIEEKFLNKFDL